jgi:imidazolonepropionase-like amidohydrolase
MRVYLREVAVYRIHVDRVVPGRGEPMADAIVVLDDERITYVGAAAAAPDVIPLDSVERKPVVMPRRWDRHVHFAGLYGAVSTEQVMLTPPEVAVARSVKDVEFVLQAGFTSIREVGGYGVFFFWAIEKKTITGPAVYAAGNVPSPTGGHSDAHELHCPCARNACRCNGMLQLADDVPEGQRTVRLQLRLSARVIKFCASGGVINQLDHPRDQQFRDQELTVIVVETARAEPVVATHCHGKAGIMVALRTGRRTIEHGSGLDDETADAMRDCGVVPVPTWTAYEAMRLLVDRVRSILGVHSQRYTSVTSPRSPPLIQ